MNATTVSICKHCHRLFDPDIIPDRFADNLLCSWHEGTAEIVGNTGPRGDYADVWLWSCCGKREVGPLIHKKSEQGQFDFPPPRSPGCKRGPHEADNSLRLGDSTLATELLSLQERLREIAAFESRGMSDSAVFISYAHRDSDFVDKLVARLSSDGIPFWRDEKDILIGDVIDRAISEGIQKNSLFLVVLTPSSIGSRWVERELDEASHEATEGRKIILPILANGLSIDNVPARLRRFKCADFHSSFDESYATLHRSIRAHVDRQRSQRKTG
jgi:hypothetical protein